MIINLALIGLTIIGGLYATLLIIAAFIGEPIDKCECGCENE